MHIVLYKEKREQGVERALKPPAKFFIAFACITGILTLLFITVTRAGDV